MNKQYASEILGVNGYSNETNNNYIRFDGDNFVLYGNFDQEELEALLFLMKDAAAAKPTNIVDGNKLWLNDAGDYHRENGPTKIDENGNRFWLNASGKYHRLDGPAIEWANGGKEWYIEGEHHRVNDPAVEYAGYKVWYIDGLIHRTDGPAKEWADGNNEWWVNGKQLTEDEFNAS